MRLSTSLIFVFLFIIFSCFSQLENYEKYMPSSSSGEIINHNYYSLSYLEDHELAEWTIYFSCKSRLDYKWEKDTIDFEYNGSEKIFRTSTGKLYHSNNCRYLSISKISITYNEANNLNLSKCNICNPTQRGKPVISKSKILPDGKPVVLRKDNFRPDPKVKNGSAELIDYAGSGYDRGHLVPAGDMIFDSLAMSESFYLSNFSPQLPGFNRGGWRFFEQFIREMTIKYDSLIIITGSTIVDQSKYTDFKTIGPNEITIPSFFYKLIIDVKRKSSIAFLFPHKNFYKHNYNDRNEILLEYICPIKDLERLTGVDFFYKLSKEEELDFEDGFNN